MIDGRGAVITPGASPPVWGRGSRGAVTAAVGGLPCASSPCGARKGWRDRAACQSFLCVAPCPPPVPILAPPTGHPAPPPALVSPSCPTPGADKARLCGGLSAPLRANPRRSSPPVLLGGSDPPLIPAAPRPRPGQWVIIISPLLPNPPLSPIHRQHLFPCAGQCGGVLPPPAPGMELILHQGRENTKPAAFQALLHLEGERVSWASRADPAMRWGHPRDPHTHPTAPHLAGLLEPPAQPIPGFPSPF